MSENILLVDDSGLMRFHLKRLLEDHGYVVYEASRGQQVLNQGFHDEMRLEGIELVLLDLYLPDCMGGEVLDFLHREYPDIPVIIVSIEAEKGTIIEMINRGASDYLVKPVRSADLLKKVMNVFVPSAHPIPGERRSTGQLGQLSEKMLEEIDRAMRTGSAVSLLVVESDPEALIRLFNQARSKLRFIDTVILDRSFLYVILPATGAPGSVVVKQKVLDALEGDYSVKTVVFPDDADKQLIEKRRIVQIRDQLIQKLS